MSKLLSKSLDLQLREGNRLDTARRKSFAKQSANDGVLSLTKLSTYAQPRHDIDQENGRPVGPSARSLHRVSHVQICARQVSRTLRPRNLPQMQHKQKPPQYTGVCSFALASPMRRRAVSMLGGTSTIGLFPLRWRRRRCARTAVFRACFHLLSNLCNKLLLLLI